MVPPMNIRFLRPSAPLAAVMIAALLLGSGLAACGRRGPPEPPSKALADQKRADEKKQREERVKSGKTAKETPKQPEKAAEDESPKPGEPEEQVLASDPKDDLVEVQQGVAPNSPFSPAAPKSGKAAIPRPNRPFILDPLL